MLFKLSILAVTLAVATAAHVGSPAVNPVFLDVVSGRTGGRIVGGVEAKPNSWPWQIALTVTVSGSSYLCGGSILNSQYVLTAAHCCEISTNPAHFTVRVGAHNRRSTTEAGAKNHAVSKLIPHPQYDNLPEAFVNNDFCLLKLAAPIAFTDKVKTVPLADSTDGPAGQKCYVTGWGAQESGALPANLREADVTIVSNAACEKQWRAIEQITITPQQVCVADPFKGSCGGDSGGPVVCQNAAGQYKLIGVVSWGHRTCGAAPSVFARTSSALDWIATSIANN